MECNDEQLYIELLYNMIENLKDKIKFKAHKIDYDNLELTIEESNFEDIMNNDFSISFQKQNGSFTLITKKSLNESKRQKIINLLESITEIDLFASYSFADMENIHIDHFVYEDSKLDFNTNILKQFDSMNQLIDLCIKKQIRPNQK